MNVLHWRLTFDSYFEHFHSFAKINHLVTRNELTWKGTLAWFTGSFSRLHVFFCYLFFIFHATVALTVVATWWKANIQFTHVLRIFQIHSRIIRSVARGRGFRTCPKGYLKNTLRLRYASTNSLGSRRGTTLLKKKLVLRWCWLASIQVTEIDGLWNTTTTTAVCRTVAGKIYRENRFPVIMPRYRKTRNLSRYTNSTGRARRELNREIIDPRKV